jgi:ACS family glucarate transporter-like MFS transporter
MPQIAGVLGSLLGGWISDYVLRRTGRRRLGRNGVAVASLAISSGLYLFAYSSPRVEVAVSLISLAFLISTFASPCAYALTMDVGGRNTAVVFSTMNMLGNIGAWASHRVVGMLLERSPDWDPILAVYLGLHLVPLLCWLILKPNVVIGEISDVSKKR